MFQKKNNDIHVYVLYEHTAIVNMSIILLGSSRERVFTDMDDDFLVTMRGTIISLFLYLTSQLINHCYFTHFRLTEDLPREAFQKREANLVSASSLQLANRTRNMSVEKVAGAANPAFIQDETCSNNNNNVIPEAEIQITRFGGSELETDDKVQKRNTYIVSNADEDKKEETVLDILVKNKTDRSAQEKHPDEFRITISDHDLRNTTVCW